MSKLLLAASAFAGFLATSALAQTATAPATPSAPAAAPAAPATPVAQPSGPHDPAAKARFERFRAICGADLQKHCGTIERGNDQARGQMRQCIDTNKAKFSADCQAAVAERDANREARKQTAPSNADKPKS